MMVQQQSDEANSVNTKLAIDSDGVLYRTHEMWAKIYSERNNIKLPASYIDQWDFYRKFKISKRYMYEIFEECWQRHDEIPLMDPKIPEYIDEIVTLGFHPCVVTAKPSPIYANSVHMANVRNGFKLKVIHCQTNADKTHSGCRLFIDDDPHLFPKLQLHQHLWLFTQPWNCFIDARGVARLDRVSGWEDIMKKLRGMCK